MFLVTLQQGFFLSFAVGIKQNERNSALALKNLKARVDLEKMSPLHFLIDPFLFKFNEGRKSSEKCSQP